MHTNKIIKTNDSKIIVRGRVIKANSEKIKYKLALDSNRIN